MYSFPVEQNGSPKYTLGSNSLTSTAKLNTTYQQNVSEIQCRTVWFEVFSKVFTVITVISQINAGTN